MIRAGSAVASSRRAATAGAVLGVGVILASAACEPFSAATPDALDGGTDAKLDAALEAGATLGTYATAVLDDAPIAYFRLDDVGVVEGGSIFDEVSKTHLGVVHGTPVFGVGSAVAGGGAVSFDGAAWIELGDRYGFDGVVPFTIEAFVKPSGTSFGHVFTKQQRTNPKQGYAITTDGTAVMERFVGDDGLKTPRGTLSTNAFWHVLCTFDGSQMALHVNGQLVGTEADSRALPAHTAPAIIGAASTTGGSAFAGTIDELAIYDKVLSPSQIIAHFKAR